MTRINSINVIQLVGDNTIVFVNDATKAEAEFSIDDIPKIVEALAYFAAIKQVSDDSTKALGFRALSISEVDRIAREAKVHE